MKKYLKWALPYLVILSVFFYFRNRPQVDSQNHPLPTEPLQKTVSAPVIETFPEYNPTTDTLSEEAAEKLLDRALRKHSKALQLWPKESVTFANLENFSMSSHSIPLKNFYKKHNGFAIPLLNVGIRRQFQVSAAASTIQKDGKPGALEVGYRGGLRLYVSTGNWRNFPAGLLFAVASEDDLASAKPIGRFTKTLADWVQALPPNDKGKSK